MRRFVASVCIGAVAAIVVAAALATTVSAATASKRTGFSGNLCSLVSAAQLSAVHVSAPCVKGRTSKKVTSTPLGPVKATHYYASWGTPGGLGGTHWLTLSALKAQASGPALALARGSYRGTVLENGQVFSTNPLASDFLDTISCENPPTEDCTLGKILELVGNYSVQISLHDTAPFVNPDNPAMPAVDEANDGMQEDTIAAHFVGIGRSVGAKL